MSHSESTPGIEPDLYFRIREELLRCDALQNNSTTKALFVAGELASWKHGVYEAENVQGRVNLLISFLHDQWTVGGENALVLLLRTLSAHPGPDDAFGPRMAALAVELAGGDPAGLLPHDPQARLAAIPTDHVPELSLALPKGSRMPLRPNPLFVGREEEMKELARAIKGVGSTAVIFQATTVTGIGGVGKTQLGAEWVHRYGKYFAGGVFWLSFAEAEGIRAEIAACGMGLRLDFQSLPLDEQVQLVLAAWQQPVPRLLIFDNCEDETLFAKWRPWTGGCRVLVTSRRARWSPTLGVQRLALGVLARKESVTLLAGYRPDLAEQPVLAEIAEEVGDLPLALHLAGSYLAAYEGSGLGEPVAYLARLRDKGLLEHSSLQGHGVTHSPTEHELHVGRTFALSYGRLDAVQHVDEVAQQLLARAAYFAPGEPIPRALLLSTVGVGNDEESLLEAEDGLRRLVALGLVEEEAAGNLVLHRLVALFAQRALGGETVRQAVEDTILDEAERLNNAGYPEPLLVWQAHLRHLTEHALLRADERTAKLCNQLAVHLRMIGAYAAARPYHERALAIWEAVLGTEHPDTAQSLNNLAGLLESTGEYGAARSYYERALAIREAVLGPEHLDTVQSLNNLAALLESRGEYGVARSYYERALAIREAVLGPEHPDTATILNNLAGLLESTGEYAEARPYYERALAIWEVALGPKHPTTATILNNLAGLLKATGDYAAARPYFERALAIHEEVLGPEHPATATILNNLAGLLKATGDYAAARSYYERALAIHEEVLGPEHPHTSTSLGNLGLLLESTGEYAEARSYFERALAIREAVLGPEHPATAFSLNNLAGLLKATGDYAAARSYFERALAIREAVLGPEHPYTAASLNNLGLLLKATGDYAAARSYYERALAIREAVLGPEHPDTAQSLNNLAELLESTEEYTAAQAYYERALTIYEAVLGPEHPTTQTVRGNLERL